MVIYWFMFLIPALASLSPYRLDKGSRRFVHGLILVALVLIIGLREHVGHDWNNYLAILRRVELWTFREAILSTEPGYSVINWLSTQLGWGIYGVNTICALIVVYCLIAFCRRQPNFWRTLAFSMPVLVIVVSMAATRQATAIGFLMLAFLAFEDRKIIRYLALVSLAVLFHRSAAIFLPLAIFMPARMRLWPLIAGGLVFLALSLLFLREAVPYYQENYLGSDIVANGALPRIAVNVLAAGGFFLFRRRWAERYDDAHLYQLMSVATLLMSSAVLYAPVGADRVVMFLLPIQVAILARLPEFIHPSRRGILTLAITTGYAAMLGVWLFFSPFAQISWIPYGNILWTR